MCDEGCFKERSCNSVMAGKGDKPRSCFSKRFRTNYELVKWRGDKSKKKRCTSRGKTIQYYK